VKAPRVEIAVASVDTPEGPLWVLCTAEGVRELRLGSSRAPTAKEGRARGASFLRRPAWTERVERALRAYLASRASLDGVSIDVEAGTAFQRRVWEAVRRVPLGAVCTYGELAARVGTPGGSRAVGNALGANPVPLVIPCHRVIQSEAFAGSGSSWSTSEGNSSWG